MLGTVAAAAVAVQMAVSRAVASGLNATRTAILCPAGGADCAKLTDKRRAGPDSSRPADLSGSRSTTTVVEVGRPGQITTTADTKSFGESQSGFLLAEAFGPHIGQAISLDRPTSELQVLEALGMLRWGDELVSLEVDPATQRVSAVIKKKDGRVVQTSYKVVKRARDRGGRIWLELDVNKDDQGDVVLVGILGGLANKQTNVDLIANRLAVAEDVLAYYEQFKQQYAEIRGPVKGTLTAQLQKMFGKKGAKAMLTAIKAHKRFLARVAKALGMKPAKVRTLLAQQGGERRVSNRLLDRLSARGDERLLDEASEQDMEAIGEGFKTLRRADKLPVPKDAPAEKIPEGMQARQVPTHKELGRRVAQLRDQSTRNYASKHPIKIPKNARLLDIDMGSGAGDNVPDLAMTKRPNSPVAQYDQFAWYRVDRKGKKDGKTVSLLGPADRKALKVLTQVSPNPAAKPLPLIRDDRISASELLMMGKQPGQAAGIDLWIRANPKTIADPKAVPDYIDKTLGKTLPPDVKQDLTKTLLKATEADDPVLQPGVGTTRITNRGLLLQPAPVGFSREPKAPKPPQATPPAPAAPRLPGQGRWEPE